MLEATQRLERAGHKLVQFPAPDIHKVMYFFNGIVLADGNKFMFQNLSWDLYDSTLYGVIAATALYNCPWLLKKFLLHPLLSLLTRIPPIQVLSSHWSILLILSSHWSNPDPVLPDTRAVASH